MEEIKHLSAPSSLSQFPPAPGLPCTPAVFFGGLSRPASGADFGWLAPYLHLHHRSHQPVYSLHFQIPLICFPRIQLEAAFHMLACQEGKKIFQGKDWWQSAVIPSKTCEEWGHMGYSSHFPQDFIRTAASWRHWSQAAVPLEDTPKSGKFIYRRIKACFKPWRFPTQALLAAFTSRVAQPKYFSLTDAEGDT